MSINVRIRNGMQPDPDTGLGGATEGDIRGSISDFIKDGGGIADLAGGQLLVHEAGTPDMTVIIDDGVVYIPNAGYDAFDSDQIKCWEAVVENEDPLTIGANSSGSTRIDLICAKLDTSIEPNEFASNVAELLVVAGTPGAGVPATPDDHYCLAQITIVNGATEIEDADISNVSGQLAFKPAVKIDDIETYSPSGSGTATLDLSLSNIHHVQMPAGNISIDFSNGLVGQCFIVRVKQDSGGSRTLTWTKNSDITWMTSDTNAPAIASGANKITTYGFVQTGAGTWDGYLVGKNA